VHVRRFIDEIGKTKNPRIRWLGLLLAMVQSRVSVHAAYEQKLREVYGDLVFENKIPLATVFKEAVSAKKPVTEFNAKSVGAQALKKVYGEVMQRIAKQNETFKKAA
jgi:cellulose biosynthesis protein BcsQ